MASRARQRGANCPLCPLCYNWENTFINSFHTIGASPDGWAVWGVVVSTRWWLLVDHGVLRNWDWILVRAVKGLISRAGMVSICPLLWQRDVKLPTNQNHTIGHLLIKQGNSVARDLLRTGSETNTTIFVIYILDIDSHCPYLLSGETTFQLTSC